MSPNKRKSYMRKLAKEGFTYEKIIDLMDLHMAQVSRILTTDGMSSSFTKENFEEIKRLFDVTKKIGLSYDNLMKLDRRPYLEGYLDARFKHTDFKAICDKDVIELCEKENRTYDFHHYENFLLDFPEFDYGTYIPVYEHDEARELGIPRDYDYIPFEEMMTSLNTLHEKYNFKYVFAHGKHKNGVSVLLHDYTHLDENRNCRVILINE